MFQRICVCFRRFPVSRAAHTQKHMAGQSPPYHSLHSTKQNKFCLLKSRMWTSSAPPRSPFPALHKKQSRPRGHKVELCELILPNEGLRKHSVGLNTQLPLGATPQSFSGSAGPHRETVSSSLVGVWESRGKRQERQEEARIEYQVGKEVTTKQVWSRIARAN